MSRETLKDFLRSEGIISDSISFGNLSDDNGNGSVDAGDDLGQDPVTGKELLSLYSEEMGLLGTYAAYITEHFFGGNEFSLEKGNMPAPSTNKGSALPAAEAAGSNNVFVKSTSTLGQHLSGYANSQNFDETEYTLHDIIDKIAGTAGNSLLADISGGPKDTSGSPNADIGDSGSSKVLPASIQVLQNNNRFTPGGDGNTFQDNRTEATSDVDFRDFITPQETFGENEQNSEAIILENLKQTGRSILLRSVGFDNADTAINPADFELTSTQAEKELNDTHSSSENSAKNAYNAPSKRVGRGAFSTAQSKNVKRSLTSPWNKYYDGENIENVRKYLRTHILTFSDILQEKAEDPKNEIDPSRSSLYSSQNFKLAVKEGLVLFFSDDSTFLFDESNSQDNRDIAYFANLSKVFKTAISSFEDTTADMTKESPAINYLNILATLGEVSLSSKQSTKIVNGKSIDTTLWDVDALPEGPATRISKSKVQGAENGRALAWRGSSLPALYHLPASTLTAIKNMGNVSRKNPAKGILASTVGDKTYFSQDVSISGNKGSGRKFSFSADDDETGITKIPKHITELMEDQLDAEYVPFYFHDLRTNEIISFHAFISSLTDNFTANYEQTSGFGRIDPVHTYKNTNRDIGFEFYAAATNEQDFDEMWFKINKLITLLYPQFSRGVMLKDTDKLKFTKPFSQVITSSPMIRLRIGDIIKSNYSRFNLSRIFGSGENTSNVSKSTDNINFVDKSLTPVTYSQSNIDPNQIQLKAFLLLLGSPMQFLELIPTGTKDGQFAKDAAVNVLSTFLKNGFSNPLLGYAINRMKDPGVARSKFELGSVGSVAQTGAMLHDSVFLKPSSIAYIENETDNKYIISRHIKCRVSERVEGKTQLSKTQFNVIVTDQHSALAGKEFLVIQDDFVIDPHWIFDSYFGPALDGIAGISGLLEQATDQLISNAAKSSGIPTPALNLISSTFEDFMHPANNSITKAFEEGSGRGLPGFIKSVNFDWINETTPWEIALGSRAPKICKIKVSFLPLHDITPGLDTDGFNRAPVYNVGKIMNNISGDPFADGGFRSEQYYNKASNDAIKGNK